MLTTKVILQAPIYGAKETKNGGCEMPPTQSTDAEYLVKEFNRDQSWIAAAYVEHLAANEHVQYSELQAIEALANYLKFDPPRYEFILSELRLRMQKMQNDGHILTMSIP